MQCVRAVASLHCAKTRTYRCGVVSFLQHDCRPSTYYLFPFLMFGVRAALFSSSMRCCVDACSRESTRQRKLPCQCSRRPWQWNSFGTTKTTTSALARLTMICFVFACFQQARPVFHRHSARICSNANDCGASESTAHHRGIGTIRPVIVASQCSLHAEMALVVAPFSFDRQQRS